MLSRFAAGLAATILFVLPAAPAAAQGEEITEFVNEEAAPEESEDSVDYAACDRLTELGIDINQSWTSARLDYYDDLIDWSELEWRLSNLKSHLENYAREAGFAGCDQLAAEMNWVLGEMTMP